MKPDCQTCGACCVAPYEQDSFCDLTKEDVKRLGRRFVRLHVLQPSTFNRLLIAMDGADVPSAAIQTRWSKSTSGPFAGYSFNTCKMLRGSVMNRVSCRIYANRPSVCRRAVKPGDKACLEIRRAMKENIESVTPV